MLGDFPHAGFADLPFFRVISNAPPLDLEPLGLAGTDPVIRVMHSYPVGRPLGYLTEHRVGKGRLIVCALTLDQTWPEGQHLLARLCRYAAGDDLAPAPALSAAALTELTAGTLLE